MEKSNDIPPLPSNVREAMQRYVSGTATVSDRAIVSTWYDAFDDSEVVVPADHPDEELLTKHRIWQKLQTHHEARPTRRSLRWLPYAAAILLACISAIWIFSSDQNVNPQATIVNQEEILPGRNRATLTLANGRTINLDETQTGIIVGMEEITYSDGSNIALSPIGGDKLEDIEELMLTTPKGGTYQIILPDGSKVWLNAASTLKYPSRFSNDERIVDIVGEGYFEIYKDTKRPFSVHSNGQTVEVLGTAFNISAYADDAETKTTLVEGAVQIINRQSNIVKQLRPGEQGASRGEKTETKYVAVEAFTSWRNGYFNFKNTPVSEVMSQLARWYNVEVVYEGTIPKETFSGKMDRTLTLNAVLKLLEVSEIRARIEGTDKLIVY